ncbi:hypothetical protein IJT17_00895 [bacterium]|nr:hypothetical protein [bacterium]
MSRSVRLIAKANRIAVQLGATEADLQQAEALLREAEQSQPSGTSWLQISRAYTELGRFDDSRRALGMARQKLKNNPALELFSAILALDEGKLSEAQGFLDELRRICSGNQALPTAQALCFLLQGRTSEALDLLKHKRGKTDSFDITVSPLLICRLAMAVEKAILPHELPEADLLEGLGAAVPRSEVPPEEKKSRTAEDNAEGTEGVQAAEGGPADEASGLDGKNAAELANAAASAGENNAEEPADKEENSGEKTAVTPKANEIDDPQELAQELKPYLPALPKDASVGGISLYGTGTERLQRAWEMPRKEQLEQFSIALHELYRSYCSSPKSYQCAFSLAEGLLAMAEYDRDRSKPYAEKSVRLVLFAERLLRQALVYDKDTAFANHYMGRTKFLQHRYSEAVSAWKSALESFAKLPEAQYGLGQAYIMLGEQRESRLHIAQAVSADMHLLRERLADLVCISQGDTSADDSVQ